MSHGTVVTAAEPEDSFTTGQRLAAAYNGAVPQAVARFFAWDYSPGDVTVSQARQAREIARSINARMEVAYGRIAEAEQRAADLERRLLQLRSQHAQARAYLAGDPPVMADAWEVGKVAVLKDGCERLIPVVERALESARAGPERARAEADNWRILSDLADVIAGVRGPTDSLARKLGLDGAWQIRPPLALAERCGASREAEVINFGRQGENQCDT